ncbi:MAG: branched-chain amino acid ABC transporter permease [Peptococcaceae bacterium]|nr:branched-chain amino acid ABC transporter permease [Peptococcaceae bacterium]
MSATLLIQLTAIGLAMGMCYAFMGMGIVLLVRAIGVLNFAQGEMFMFGAFIAMTLTQRTPLPFPAVVLAAILIFALGGFAFMLAIYWPLRNASWSASIIIATLSASIAFKEIATKVWGPVAIPMDPLIKGSFAVGTLSLSWQYVVIIIVGVAVFTGLLLLFEKMYVGHVMQAAAQDKTAAELLGISTFKTTAATYAISTVLAGLGGWLVAPLFFCSISLGQMLTRAFAGLILGGYDSVKGVLVGALIVGVVESYISLISTTYKDALLFALVLVMLSVRPHGLFGSPVKEKA